MCESGKSHVQIAHDSEGLVFRIIRFATINDFGRFLYADSIVFLRSNTNCFPVLFFCTIFIYSHNIETPSRREKYISNLILVKGAENMKIGCVLFIIIAIISIWSISSAEIDYGRTIYDSILPNSGHSLAGYSGYCAEKFDFEFTFSNLTGGMHANLNLNGSNRYAIGFINLDNGSLATYLFRQEMGQIKHFSGNTIYYDPSKTYHVEIISEGGDVQAFMKGIQDANATKVIDYFDENSLPPGEIDLETLENSSVQFNQVAINCEKPGKEKLPNLGVGYFKPPVSH